MVKFQSIELNRLVSMKSGETITAQHIDDYGEYPCFGGNGLRGYTKKYTHHGAFALIGRQGALCGNVTYVNGYFFASEHAIVVTPKEENIIKYIYYVLDAMHLNQYVESSAQPGLSVNKLLNLSAYVSTDSNEQQRIATVLADIDTLISSLKTLIAKKKAIKQGAMQELLTGKKRLPGFSKDWVDYQLRDLGAFDKGSGISRAESNTGKVPAVRYGELYTTHQNYVTRYVSHISKEVAANAKRVYRGDILFAASGETKEEIGKCAAIIDDQTIYAGGDILIFRPVVQLNPVFMGTLLNTTDVCKQRAEKGQGDAVVHIHADSLGSIKIKIPEIKEQDTIAEILFEMDQEIESLEMKLEKYRQIKQGMMQQLLTGKIRLV